MFWIENDDYHLQTRKAKSVHIIWLLINNSITNDFVKKRVDFNVTMFPAGRLEQTVFGNINNHRCRVRHAMNQ